MSIFGNRTIISPKSVKSTFTRLLREIDTDLSILADILLLFLRLEEEFVDLLRRATEKLSFADCEEKEKNAEAGERRNPKPARQHD